MKTFTLFVTASLFTLSTFATDAPAPKKKTTTTPHYYIMMKKGKLIEVSNGHRTIIKKDKTLVNESTIHPNGSIDAGSGQNLQLKEGQYLTMDGKIRNLKDMPKKKK